MNNPSLTSQDSAAPIGNEEDPSVATEVWSIAPAGGLIASVVARPLIGVGACMTMGAVALSNTRAGTYSRQAGRALVKTSKQIQGYKREHHIIARSKKGTLQGYKAIVETLQACNG